jgi:hypothetical protein
MDSSRIQPRLCPFQARIFWGGGAHPPPPEMICTLDPEAFGTAPKSFCTPANYIYFDLIVSYLIILSTKFVKLPILWSQISPCRPRKQILLNVFLGLSGRCHHAPAKASSSTPPDIYPPPRTKIWKSVSDPFTVCSREVQLCGTLVQRR